MSFPCIYGGRECNGCMKCQDKTQAHSSTVCAHCGEAIFDGEDRYEFPDGSTVHDDCMIGHCHRKYLRHGN